MNEHVDLSTPTQLAQQWQTFKRENSNVRIRNAAGELDVSEGELVATSCGDSVIRIEGEWGKLLKKLPKLGEVLVITRNDNAVHEKIGKFAKVSVQPSHGLVVTREIDLRIFFGNWHFGFAVTEETKNGPRYSLQFFDLTGTSVHKVYLTDNSNKEEYDTLVRQFISDDQQPLITTSKAPTPKTERADSDVDIDAFRAHWQAMQDTHDFMGLLREFDVARTQALRLAGDDLASRVPVGAFEKALKNAAETGLSIMVFVGNRGCIQIHTGPIKRVVKAQGWLNVLDPGFDLHVKDQEIAEAWIVRKPTRDGVVTSLEVFDTDGQEILLMFGERKPGVKELPEWVKLAESLVSSEAVS
jgi:putative hemin transport protein